MLSQLRPMYCEQSAVFKGLVVLLRVSRKGKQEKMIINNRRDEVRFSGQSYTLNRHSDLVSWILSGKAQLTITRQSQEPILKQKISLSLGHLKAIPPRRNISSYAWISRKNSGISPSDWLAKRLILRNVVRAAHYGYIQWVNRLGYQRKSKTMLQQQLSSVVYKFISMVKTSQIFQIKQTVLIIKIEPET